MFDRKKLFLQVKIEYLYPHISENVLRYPQIDSLTELPSSGAMAL